VKEPAQAKHRKHLSNRQPRPLRQSFALASVLIAAAAPAPWAAAGPYSQLPRKPPQHVVVRTELVAERHGFDWLDAAAGFGLAIVSVLAVLLAVHRPRVLSGTRAD
jgi:hypothetical protein